MNRALAHARKQDNTGVLRDAEAALQLDPSLAAAYLLRGTAYSNRKSHDLALADLNRALQLDPRNALAFHERGLAFARKGEWLLVAHGTRVSALHADTAVRLFSVPTGGASSVKSMSVSRDGEWLATTAAREHRVHLWKLSEW